MKHFFLTFLPIESYHFHIQIVGKLEPNTCSYIVSVTGALRNAMVKGKGWFYCWRNRDSKRNRNES